jgi:hypothetical protein
MNGSCWFLISSKNGVLNITACVPAAGALLSSSNTSYLICDVKMLAITLQLAWGYIRKP